MIATRTPTTLVAAAFLVAATLFQPSLAAQDADAPDTLATAAPARPNHITLTGHMVGLTVGYARAIRPNTLLGGEVGAGGDLFSAMAVGGRHFGQWLSYEERDAAGDESLFELAHVGAFVRRVHGDRLDYDVGLRASAFFHWDESDDDPGGGLFAGAYGTVMVGWRRVKLGPRVQVGLFDEGGGTRELGVYVVPLTVRATFSW